MHAGIECVDRPDRTQPAEHECPTGGPCRQVLHVGEDVATAVTFVHADRKGDDRSQYQDKIHGHENSLESTHNPGQRRRENCMAANARNESSVYDTVGRMPIAVSGDDDDGKKHDGETI